MMALLNSETQISGTQTLINDDRGGPKTSLLISAENINALIPLL